MKKQAYRGLSAQQQSKTNAAHGFTMVEVIVAIAILSTSMLAVFGVLRTCLAADSRSRMLTRSVLLAESLMTETMLKRNITYETTQGSKGPFNWQIQVAPTQMDNLGAVCVQVKWPRQQQYELFSLVHNPAVLEGN
ncbi:prepilin-type N-terminal cleavage/methylation domain-containing protein [Planctomycetota bacterium]